MILAKFSKTSGLISNVLEHYDTALFSLLAPFIAAKFFPPSSYITQLMMTYFLIPLTLFSKPIGSLALGYISDKIGKKQALYISVFGVSFATFSIGCLPTYEEVGWSACIWLSLARIIQGFFGAAEVTSAALVVLENTEKNNRTIMSSFFDATSVLGMLLASLIICVYLSHDLIEGYWRTLFWIGGGFGIFSISKRIANFSENPFSFQSFFTENLKFCFENKWVVFSLIFFSGLSYITYSISFSFLSAFIPLITSYSFLDLLKMNSLLLLIDIISLPVFGYMAYKFGKVKVMKVSALLLSVFSIPLFSVLNNASLLVIGFIRLFVVLCGVSFSAPFYALAVEILPSNKRFFVLSLATVLGAQMLGSPANAISLWLFKVTGTVANSGAYISIVSISSFYLLHKIYLRKTSLV